MKTTKTDSVIKRLAAAIQGNTDRAVMDSYLIGFCTGSILVLASYFIWVYLNA